MPDNPTSINITEEVTQIQTVTIATAGPQGPTGPQGPAGPQGPPGSAGSSYTQVISTPSSSFVVTHNLGRLPNVSWIDDSGHYAIPDVTSVDDNNVYFVFPYPVTGTVICS